MDNLALINVLNSCLEISKDTSIDSLEQLINEITRTNQSDTDCQNLIHLIRDFIKSQQSATLTLKLSELITLTEGLKSSYDLKTLEAQALKEQLTASYQAMLPAIKALQTGVQFNFTDFKQQMIHSQKIALQLTESINKIDDKMTATQFAKYSRQRNVVVNELKSLNVVADSFDSCTIKLRIESIENQIINANEQLNFLNSVHRIVVFRQLKQNQTIKITQLDDELSNIKYELADIRDKEFYLQEYLNAKDKDLYLSELNELVPVSYSEYVFRDMTREKAREQVRCIDLFLKQKSLQQEKKQALDSLNDTVRWLSENDRSDDKSIPLSLESWVSSRDSITQSLYILMQKQTLLTDLLNLILLCFQYASFADETDVDEQEVSRWMKEHELLRQLNGLLALKAQFDAKEADIKSLHLELKSIIKEKKLINSKLSETGQLTSINPADAVLSIQQEARRIIDILTPKVIDTTPPPAPISIKPILKRQLSQNFNQFKILNSSIINNWLFIDDKKKNWYRGCYDYVLSKWPLLNESRKIQVLNLWSDLEFDILNPKNNHYPIWSIYQTLTLDELINIKPDISPEPVESKAINHDKLDKHFKDLFEHCNQLSNTHPREALLFKRLSRHLYQIYIHYQDTKKAYVLEQMNQCVRDPMYQSLWQQRGFKRIFSLIDSIFQLIGEKIDPRKTTLEGRNYRLFNPRTTSQKLVDRLMSTCQPLAV